MKKYRGTLILTSLIILLPMLVGVLLWDQLPDRVATHFGMDNTPNGWTDKGVAVFGLPIGLLVVHFICAFFLSVDPKKQNMSEKLKHLVFWIIPIVSMLLMICSYGYELGYEWNTGLFVRFFVGVLFLIIGNYLPKCKQNYSMGIKLPWTLNDEENWNHTHRFAGFVWAICGAIMLVNIFMGLEWLIFALVAVMVLAPAVYSYLYDRKHGASN